MTPEDVIQEVVEHASEYLEMADNPASMVAGILAKRIVELQAYVEYLERRLGHDDFFTAI